VLDKKTVLDHFLLKFGNTDGAGIFFSPGRVNLIGEHIDYNGGLVFPCAIDLGIFAAARKNNSGRLNIHSLNFPSHSDSLSINELDYNKEHGWQNYVKGVLKSIFELTGIKSGFDIVFHGNLPDGAGLSSSACLELLTAVIADNILELNITTLDLVKICQKTENEYIGLKCGIMDQFAIGFGKINQAILLNCETLDYRYTPIETKGYSLVITNSNKRRELADSKYNERRSECESALNKLNQFIHAENLCRISEDELNTYSNNLSKIEYKRALHVITENRRTIQASEALASGNINLFGQLMNSSHISLKNNYEVTGKELDILALTAQKMEFVLGSRMTGAGFGGCVISLVKDECFDVFKHSLGALYRQECGLKADFYKVKISGGTAEI